MIKAKNWKGNDLKGEWEVTLKIDGVRMLRDEDGNPVSRAGKPLYNLEGIDDKITDAEIFLEDWETSVSMVRTKEGTLIKNECAYSLEPMDRRLWLADETDPTSTCIMNFLAEVTELGYEGLMLRQGDTWLKVKPTETFDVPVLQVIEGTGKYVGMMGALMTPKGKVGTGFTDKDRYDMWHRPWGDELIEVECMSLTKDGKFRHPRFKRIRWDK
jgi:hypothetical protein